MDRQVATLPGQSSAAKSHGPEANRLAHPRQAGLRRLPRLGRDYAATFRYRYRIAA
ncbi:hypothetical protein I545_3736 [Mycobacterium kansasii 662]|uniref:Uncharacterized protein n=2 Tax=Mycobacterium kansasii TaxID=1768 RepID=A0A1V3XEU7_MYCKA|nr:hypothetical protein I547_5478 [Mycobacterium kansasii 824]EUA17007.1 hypothetical protein I545_3736 [Mycobacterium kansasii 662]KEP41658.1 hypothetical protein MKSMC1_31280 [Mycobacterium kansasii]OOK77707.1 hypothetical protein BZL29_3743 [Mycobacterium kansasii]